MPLKGVKGGRYRNTHSPAGPTDLWGRHSIWLMPLARSPHDKRSGEWALRRSPGATGAMSQLIGVRIAFYLTVATISFPLQKQSECLWIAQPTMRVSKIRELPDNRDW